MANGQTDTVRRSCRNGGGRLADGRAAASTRDGRRGNRSQDRPGQGSDAGSESSGRKQVPVMLGRTPVWPAGAARAMGRRRRLVRWSSLCAVKPYPCVWMLSRAGLLLILLLLLLLQFQSGRGAIARTNEAGKQSPSDSVDRPVEAVDEWMDGSEWMGWDGMLPAGRLGWCDG